tara:strand:+ start:136247 stop:136684 length:438 start_codon:yes stop_codon:yes gene_type:complete
MQLFVTGQSCNHIDMAHGGYAGSKHFQTAKHRSAALLAIFALFLHIAIPTLYDLAPPQVQGLMQVTICSGGEARQILVDENGQPVKQVPSENHNCHSCLHHCGAMALADFTAIMPTFSVLAGFSLATSLTHGLITKSAQARAPPL